MADAAAPHEKVGPGKKASPLLNDAAPDTAELEGACPAKETAMPRKGLLVHERRTTLVDQIALLEAVRGSRRRWTRSDDKDAGPNVPLDPIQTTGIPSRKTRVYFVWVALALLFLVAVLALEGTPRLCLQGYCLTYQPSPVTAFRGGPSHDMTVLLRERDQSAGAAEWVWSLGADGKLSRKQIGLEGEWDTYEATRFLGAPVVQRRGSIVRLFAVEAGTGHLMVGAFFREDDRRFAGSRVSFDIGEEARRRADAWERGWVARPGAWGWHSLGGRLVNQPTIAESSSGHVEVYAVTEEGSLLRRVLTPGPSGGWGAWSALGSHGFVGEVDVLISYMDHGHFINQGEVRAAALKDGQYQFSSSGVSPQPWNGVWQPLGVPDGCRGGAELGWPVLVGLGRGVFEFVVACGGNIWHKTYGWDGEWSARWKPLGTGPRDVRLDTHSLTRSSRSNDGPASLYAHASASGCVYHSTFIGRDKTQFGQRRHRRSQWSYWRHVWCPKEMFAVSNVSLAVETTGGRALVLGEPGGKFLYSGMIDFRSSDPLQWQRYRRPQ